VDRFIRKFVYYRVLFCCIVSLIYGTLQAQVPAPAAPSAAVKATVAAKPAKKKVSVTVKAPKKSVKSKPKRKPQRSGTYYDAKGATQSFYKNMGWKPNQANWVELCTAIWDYRKRDNHDVWQMDIASKAGELYLVCRDDDERAWRWHARHDNWIGFGRADWISVAPDGTVWRLWKNKLCEFQEDFLGYRGLEKFWAMKYDWSKRNRKKWGEEIQSFKINKDEAGNLYAVVTVDEEEDAKSFKLVNGEWKKIGDKLRFATVTVDGTIVVSHHDKGIQVYTGSYSENTKKGSWEKLGKHRGRRMVEVYANGTFENLFIAAVDDDDEIVRRIGGKKGKWLVSDEGWHCAITADGDFYKVYDDGIYRWVDGQLFTSGKTSFIHNPKKSGASMAFDKNWRLPKVNHGAVLFQARGLEDISVGLSSRADFGKKSRNSMYQIEIGGADNSRTKIRRGWEDDTVAETKHKTALIPTGHKLGTGMKFSWWWITFDVNKKGHAHIKVGRGSRIGHAEKLKYQDKNRRHGIRYIGFGGWKSYSVEYKNIQFFRLGEQPKKKEKKKEENDGMILTVEGDEVTMAIQPEVSIKSHGKPQAHVKPSIQVKPAAGVVKPLPQVKPPIPQVKPAAKPVPQVKPRFA